MHSRRFGCLVAVAVFVTCLASANAATHCPPGWGLKNFNILGVLGGIISGNPSTSEPRCQPCGSWEASQGGDDVTCELCVPGISTPNAFKTACDCVPGTYVAPDGTTTASSGVQKNCIRCAENAVSGTTNAKSCTECPAGTVPGKNNKCNCPPGFQATAVTEIGAAACAKCDKGLVSPGGLVTSCTACPEYSVPLSSGDYCGCLPGSKLESSNPFKCAACATVFEYTAAANRLFTCQQCYPFSYATEDHTGCECSGGYYAPNPEAQPVRCRPCPAGMFKPGRGNDVGLCTKCPDGLEPSGSGRQCVKALCPAGTEEAANGTCIACDATHYNLVKGGKCQACLNNTLASPERTRCDECAEGYMKTSDTGETMACMKCMIGWKWNTTTSTCDVDHDIPTGDQPLDTTIPDENAWKRFIPKVLADSDASRRFSAARHTNDTTVKKFPVYVAVQYVDNANGTNSSAVAGSEKPQEVQQNVDTVQDWSEVKVNSTSHP